MGAVTLDASVLLGFLRPEDAHHDAARTLVADHASDAKLVSASVYAEIMVHAIVARRDDDVDGFLFDLSAEIVPVGRRIARRAAQLRGANPALRLPDAFVLATAHEREARLLTFDRRLARFAT